MEFTHVVVHYAEIGTKGKNRPAFENQLVENIRSALGQGNGLLIKRIFGRIIIELSGKVNIGELADKLKNVFGISYFAFAVSCEQNLGSMKKAASEVLGYEKKRRDVKSVRVLTKRSTKNFPMTSMQVNEAVGEHMVKGHGMIVDLVDADLSITIEVVERYAFVFSERIQGLGGLPVGVSGRVAVMLSGGIDSPVAAFKILKRGCRIVGVHFHSVPYTRDSSKRKVVELAGVLAKHQPQIKIYMVPFIDIQKEIMKGNKKYRVVVYRRFMMRIAERIGRMERCSAIVTGENLAQVASQTIGNMGVIESVVDMPVLRPVVAMDKQEIIDEAKKIGTYEISIQPYEDCCSLFVPEHPTTNANIEIVEGVESGVNMDLIDEALRKSEKITVGLWKSYEKK